MTLAFYGEPKKSFALLDMIRNRSLATVDGLGLTASQSIRVGIGLIPILLVRYDFTFNDEVRARDLISYIQRAQDKLIDEQEFTYHTFFGNKRTVDLIYETFIEHMTPRMGIGTIDDDEGSQLIYSALPGDLFTIAAFGHKPIPGTRFVA